MSKKEPENEVYNDPRPPRKDTTIDMTADSATFPPALADTSLERRYLGLILNEIKAIAVYYFTFEDAYFVDDNYLNVYKKILFTDGEKYAPREAKDGFNFAKESYELYDLKVSIQDEFVNNEYDMEVTAVVTSVSKKYDKDEDQYRYRATYEYEVRGQKYNYVSSWSSTHYEKGDQMLLTVNSDNPGEVNNYKYLTIGAFIIIVAVFVLYFSFR